MISSHDQAMTACVLRKQIAADAWMQLLNNNLQGDMR